MGGQPRFPYPKEVWSPSGGWWAFPRAWRANTLTAFAITFAISVPIFIASENRMERFGKPKVRIPWRPNLEVDEEYR